jgi:DNA-binding NtrC family response regulator
LKNFIENNVVLHDQSEGELIDLGEVELQLRDRQRFEPPKPMTLREARVNAEQSAIRNALTRAEGRFSKAAEILDISLSSLTRLLKKHQC